MTYVKVNDALYEATILGRVQDPEWNMRGSKSIRMNGTYESVNALFSDGTAWSIVEEQKIPIVENGEVTGYNTKQKEFNNSEYCVRGDLTMHTDGTVTVKMGKPTLAETAQAKAEEYAENLKYLGVEV